MKARQWLQLCLEYKISAIEYMWLEKIFICVYLSCFSVQIWFLKKKRKKILISRESNCVFQKKPEFLSIWDVLKLNGITKSYLVALKTQGLLAKQLIIQYLDRLKKNNLGQTYFLWPWFTNSVFYHLNIKFSVHSSDEL